MGTVISLGWGVQSFGLAAMSALGLLPKVDAAIHADTGFEREETYRFAAKWTPWLEERGVRVVTVQAKAERRKPFVLRGQPSVVIPAYTIYPDGRKSSMLRRQCTLDWKIAPINRWIVRNLGETADVWLGITLDEVERVRPSRDKRITNKFPYLQMLDHPWRRNEVVDWLVSQGLDVPVKSGCYFCPFHGRATWREIKNNPNDWNKMLEVDRAIRHFLPNRVCYLNNVPVPMDELDLRTPVDFGQLELALECTGHCFS